MPLASFAQDLVLTDRLVQEPQRGPVFWGGIVEIVGRDDPIGARHVRGNDRRIAGNVPPDVAGKQPPVLVVTATRAESDDDGDGLAFEVAVGLGFRVMPEADRKGGNPETSNQRTQRCPLRHGSLPKATGRERTGVLA